MTLVKQEKTQAEINKSKGRKGHTNNPHGRPRVPEIQMLREAIEAVEKKKDKKLLHHFVEQAYEDRVVLVALCKKILPDKMEGELPKDICITIVPTPAVK